MAHKRTLIWSFAFSFLAVVAKGGNLLVAMYLASVFPASVYASFGVLYAFQAAMGTFSIAGLGEFAVANLKKYSRRNSVLVLFKRVSGLYLPLAVLWVVPLFILSTLFFDDDGVSAAAAVFSLLLGALLAFANLQASLLRLDDRYGESLLLHAGVPIASATGMAMAAWLDNSIAAVFIGGCVGGLAMLGVLLANKIVYTTSLRLRAPERENLSATSPYAQIAVVGWLSGYGMNLFIMSQGERGIVAVYTILYTIAALSQLLASSVNMARAPVFYSLFNAGKRDEASRFNRRIFSILAIVLGVFGAVVVFFLPLVTLLIGGHAADYGSYQLELALLFCGYVVSVPWWCFQNYYYVCNEGRALRRVILLSGTVGLLAWMALIAIWDEMGVFVGFVIRTGLQSVYIWTQGRDEWEVEVPWLSIIVGCLLVFFGIFFQVHSN